MKNVMIVKMFARLQHLSEHVQYVVLWYIFLLCTKVLCEGPVEEASALSPSKLALLVN